MADYYNILGVPKDAPDDVLRKAYHRLAVQWHPDKNLSNKDAATERFKQIAQAYQVLSDPQQRSAYDRGGNAGAAAGGSDHSFGGHADPHDTFRQFFAQMATEQPTGGVNFATFGHFQGMPFQQQDPGPRFYELPLTLEEVFRGCRKRLHTRNVDVPMAVDDGARLASSDGRAVFVVRMQGHPRFDRLRLDLIHHVAFSFWDFWQGCFYETASIDGTKVRVRLKARSFTPVVLANLGLRRAAGGSRGSLVIRPCLLHPRVIEAFKAVAKSALGVLLLIICLRNPELLYILGSL